jgi:hypothetical protein
LRLSLSLLLPVLRVNYAVTLKDVPLLSRAELHTAAKEGLAAVGLAELHLCTDLPIIFSDGACVIFDPQGLLGRAFYVDVGWHGRMFVLENPELPSGDEMNQRCGALPYLSANPLSNHPLLR